MIAVCDCGAASDGKWSGVHSPHCNSFKQLTPGPWRWMSDTALVQDSGHRRVVMSCRMETCGDDGRMTRMGKDHPNAVLIAAAPELVERITDLLSYLDGEISGPAQRDAIIAEAKATLGRVAP